MKIASFIHDGEIHIGIVEQDTITDAGLRPVRQSPADPLCEVEIRPSGLELPIDAVELLAPIPWPSKAFGVGLNYRAHVQEGAGGDVPLEPMLFAVFPNAVIAHGAAIPLPTIEQTIDYEGELAVIIGREAKSVSVDEALEYVFGYTCANDVSARTAQRAGNWIFGKSSDGFLPLGPWIVTSDEIPDPQALEIRCLVNGEVRQQGPTSEMVFSVAEIIAYISQAVTLVPGDVIATGTMAGVGAAQKPPAFLQAGDVVQVEVSGIGMLENSVAAADREPAGTRAGAATR
jgi:2-keto-4-pentenoate hydratase/2-oxohepta-3-ene-1,7-dioic acid hydratase in catechol pathway